MDRDFSAMYKTDGSRASFEVWMDWIDSLCIEDFKQRELAERHQVGPCHQAVHPLAKIITE